MGNIKMGEMTRSKEDYLRALLRLSECGVSIHSADIAITLGVSRASVSRMMDILKDSGYISKEKYGTITLTEKGGKVASCIRKRHDLLRIFLTDVLGVEAVTANGDACRMEHAISIETTNKLDQRIERLTEFAKVMYEDKDNNLEFERR